MKGKSKLHFSRVPSVLLRASFLDKTDINILALIIDGQERRQRMSLSELMLLTRTGKNGVIYSLAKLIFAGLVKKASHQKANGHVATNEYIFVEETETWLLTHGLRNLLNEYEDRKGSDISLGMKDYVDHFVWISNFELTLKPYLRHYLDAEGRLKKSKSKELNHLSRTWGDFYRSRGASKEGLAPLQDKVEKDFLTAN